MSTTKTPILRRSSITVVFNFSSILNTVQTRYSLILMSITGGQLIDAEALNHSSEDLGLVFARQTYFPSQIK